MLHILIRLVIYSVCRGVLCRTRVALGLGAFNRIVVRGIALAIPRISDIHYISYHLIAKKSFK